MLMMIKNRLSLISNNNENDQSSYNEINRIIIEDYKNIEYNGNTPKKEQSLSQSPQLWAPLGFPPAVGWIINLET